MIVELKDFSAIETYHLMTQTIIPRPIAWVLTENADSKTHNLAPFSYFNAVCSEPPLVMFSCAKKPDGSPKDTVINTLREKRLVIHIASVEQVKAIEETAKPLAYGQSEVELAELKLCDFEGTGLKRLSDVPVAFACRLYKSETIGANQTLIFAEIEKIYISDETVQKTPRYLAIDANKIEPLVRLGRGLFSNIGQSFKA